MYEIWILFLILAVGLVGGWLADHALTGIFLALTGYLLWQGYQLASFVRWLAHGRLSEPRDAAGVWGEIYYLVYGHYVRERRKRQRLRGVLQQYQLTAAALPDAAVVLDREHRIEWLNEAGGRLLNLHPGRDVGQRIDNLLRDPDFVAYLHSGHYEEPLVLSPAMQPDLVLELHIIPYGQAQRLLVARDITRLHRIEVMRRDFVANVSHELRTPLSIVMGYLETLDGEDGGDKRLRAALAAMRQQCDRMSRLIEDLLMISRLETEPQSADQPVDVPRLVRTLGEEIAPLCEAKQQTLVLEAEHGPWLRGDEQNLYSAFANLASNAVRYTPEGGRILVRWRYCGDGACLEVKDTGIGIPAPALPRLTERFFRVDAGRSREMGGTGLGLAIVKHVLKQHQAELEVESTPGKGSLFRCRFPAERILRQQPRSP
ncbi:MAG TPA: phosphate regulon sensor histidine kinase PhoR [Gammaproteobacteria bacterium]|nr:phosphate regulon sensor histidine kinase PhoR [Gammaproteobacteria bacterium]